MKSAITKTKYCYKNQYWLEKRKRVLNSFEKMRLLQNPLSKYTESVDKLHWRKLTEQDVLCKGMLKNLIPLLLFTHPVS